ncbi:MAG TPA: Gfo/Idh/MocA family oxidoreductase [Vicinamibacterales bacterium]|jgi:predicted dehydrogenase
MSEDRSTVTRREFVKTTAAAAVFSIVPRHVLGRGYQAPSDIVNIATVGVSGMGSVNTRAVMSQNIVALCDCDFDLLDGKLAEWAKTAKQTPQNRQAPPPPAQAWKDWGPSKAQQAADARWPAQDNAATLRRFVDEQLPRVQKYRDYREMLEKQKDIDAVIVATPDHMHAVIASNAMSLGKHVYVQKPLCWSVAEARHLAKKAADTKVFAQMGNQRHSSDATRRAIEYIQNGAIGDVREVHVWTNRPLGFWPQGIPRPAPIAGDPAQLSWNNRGIMQRLAGAMAGTSGSVKVPDRLSWDLFLGVAPQVEYHPVYHPFNWRGWVDWGQGALGDMGAHLMDFPVWSLKLGLPAVIETESTPFNSVCYPNATTTHFEFPERKGLPPVTLTWYDGGLMPSDPPELEDEQLDPGGGVLYIGKKGKLYHTAGGRLLPNKKHNEYGPPKERLPRVPHGEHEMNWVNAICGRDQLSVPFDYASLLTEIMLLGIVSLRAGSKLHYDAANMRVTNNLAANDFLTREYRKGYSL